jgi:hypothetical protein
MAISVLHLDRVPVDDVPFRTILSDLVLLGLGWRHAVCHAKTSNQHREDAIIQDAASVNHTPRTDDE